MIKTTRWRPDTCGCEIEYEWDDSVTAENRVHKASKIIKACSVHSANLTKENHYDKVLKENQMKNQVWGKLLEDPTLVNESLDADGNVAKNLKPGIKYDWSFDKDRNLIVDIIGGSKKQKDDLKAKTDILFGTKVAIK